MSFILIYNATTGGLPPQSGGDFKQASSRIDHTIWVGPPNAWRIACGNECKRTMGHYYIFYKRYLHLPPEAICLIGNVSNPIWATRLTMARYRSDYPRPCLCEE